MNELTTRVNLTGHDDIYQQLVEMHDGLTEDESLRAWSRLALLLINHLGDRQVVAQAIAAARSSPIAR